MQELQELQAPLLSTRRSTLCRRVPAVANSIGGAAHFSRLPLGTLHGVGIDGVFCIQSSYDRAAAGICDLNAHTHNLFLLPRSAARPEALSRRALRLLASLRAQARDILCCAV